MKIVLIKRRNKKTSGKGRVKERSANEVIEVGLTFA